MYTISMYTSVYKHTDTYAPILIADTGILSDLFMYLYAYISTHAYV